MSALRLTLRQPPIARIDVSPLQPDRLRDLSRQEIQSIPLFSGKSTTVDQLFDVTGNDADRLEFHGDCHKLDRIGYRMGTGSITVHGAAGAYLGEAMAGGEITVDGDSGPWTASGMTGGIIRVAGNAGDFLGGALPGGRFGMRGGTALVSGNAGDRVADRMRRGLISIRGVAGDYCGSRMLAGTVVAFGGAGSYTGYAMKRGTLLFGIAPRSLPIGFNESGEIELVFLRLLMCALPQRNQPQLESVDRVWRSVGDRAYGGKGEVLVWTESPTQQEHL